MLFRQLIIKTCKTVPKCKEAKSNQYLTASNLHSQVLKKSFIPLRIQIILSQERQVNSKSIMSILAMHQKCKELSMIKLWVTQVGTAMDSHSTHIALIIKNSNREESYCLNMGLRKSYKVRDYLPYHLEILADLSSRSRLLVGKIIMVSGSLFNQA